MFGVFKCVFFIKPDADYYKYQRDVRTNILQLTSIKKKKKKAPTKFWNFKVAVENLIDLILKAIFTYFICFHKAVATFLSKFFENEYFFTKKLTKVPDESLNRLLLFLESLSRSYSKLHWFWSRFYLTFPANTNACVCISGFIIKKNDHWRLKFVFFSTNINFIFKSC